MLHHHLCCIFIRNDICCGPHITSLVQSLSNRSSYISSWTVYSNGFVAMVRKSAIVNVEGACVKALVVLSVINIFIFLEPTHPICEFIVRLSKIKGTILLPSSVRRFNVTLALGMIWRAYNPFDPHLSAVHVRFLLEFPSLVGLKYTRMPITVVNFLYFPYD